MVDGRGSGIGPGDGGDGRRETGDVRHSLTPVQYSTGHTHAVQYCTVQDCIAQHLPKMIRRLLDFIAGPRQSFAASSLQYLFRQARLLFRSDCAHAARHQTARLSRHRLNATDHGFQRQAKEGEEAGLSEA